MLHKLNSHQPILAFGDSLTFGFGATDTQSYPAVLSKLINHQVINEGINGELSYTGSQRLESLLEDYQPQLLILCHGANDMLQGLNLDKMAKNLRRMIKLAQERNIQVILIAVPQINPKLTPIDQYQEVSDEKQIVIENKIFTDILQCPELLCDDIHPNNLGYEKIAKSKK